MRFVETHIAGAFLIAGEPRTDARGSFSRVWCRSELARHGLRGNFVQCNEAVSACAGTIRGLHLQSAPFEEAKLVRCTRGAIFDAIVDLRPQSPSYLRWFGVELKAAERVMLFAPPGCAHGYLTLRDDCEVVYDVTAPYSPSHESGIRWNDPLFDISWPMAPRNISAKDRAWPDYVPCAVCS